MKISKTFLAIFALASALSGFAPRTAHADVSFEYFSENLDPYGEWIETSDYGYCWRPSGVSEDWAPYTDGYWAYTDAGWTWVSYEDYGNITYHYGRWARLGGRIGWCWVPGYEWAPAWVSWRSGRDYVGWAPLPPECHFRHEVGISFWADTTYGIGPGNYNFCAYRDFGAPALGAVIINRNRNVAIINNTTNITNITVNNSRNFIYNGGPNYQTAVRRSARPIQTLQLVQQTDVNAIRASGGKNLARRQGNQLIVAAPQVNAPNGRIAPQRLAKTLGKTEVDRGWSGVNDPRLRQQLEAKFKHDSKGLSPDKAHARAVTANELNVVNQQPNVAPAANQKVKGDKKPKGIASVPMSDPVVAAPINQTVAATPAPQPKDNKNKNPKSGLRPFAGSAEQNARGVAAAQSEEKKPKHTKPADQPNPELEQARLQRQQQQQIQAQQIHQQKLQQQQAAHEHQAQLQQELAAARQQRDLQRQQQAVQAVQGRHPVQQLQQANPQGGERAPDRGKGKKKDKKDDAPQPQ